MVDMEYLYTTRDESRQDEENRFSNKSLVFFYLLNLLHIPLNHILSALNKLLTELPSQSNEVESTNYELMADESDHDIQIIKVNKLKPIVTNDYHILRHKYLAIHRDGFLNQNNNSIIVDEVSELPDFNSHPNQHQGSEQNILRSLVNQRIKNTKAQSRPALQYGTDLLLSNEYLKNSKYQQDYRPSQHAAFGFEDEGNYGEHEDDLLNLTIHESPNRKYHQSVLNYYIPSKPVSTADYSVLDSAVSNFYIDDNTSNRYQTSHKQTQEQVTKKRIQSLSKIIPLNSGQLSKVMEIWNSSGNRQLFNLFQIDVFYDDIKTLRDGRWLNDNIIDLYLNLVTQSNSKAYAWTTHFFTTLQEKGYQGVARWAKRRKLNVFDKEVLLVPINIMNTHWALAVVDNANKKIEYYDSLSSSGNINAIKILSSYMSLEAERLNHEKITYELLPRVKTPQQANGYDCGVFACTAAKYVSSKTPLTYSQNDMKVIRRRMAFEILNKELLTN